MEPIPEIKIKKKKKRRARPKQGSTPKSIVSAPVAAFLSAIIPGLGQVLATQFSRGLLLMAAFFSSSGLLAWRVYLLAHREPTAMAMFSKALGRRPFFVGLVMGSIFLIWLWNIRDAARQTRPERRGGVGIFVLVVFVFFSLGWQISEINPYKAITDLPQALPPLSRVLWPWKAAFTYRTETVKAHANILIGCEDPLPQQPERGPGEPYLKSDPTCGELSRLDENNNVIKGTVLTIEGGNFEPNSEAQIWWVDSLGNEFRPRQEGQYVSVTTDSEGSFKLELVMPYRLTPPSARGRQIHKVEARQVERVGGPIPAEPLRLTISRMIETIFMGMMATIFGIVLAIPISFLAARNLMSGSFITMGIYYITRTILNIVRSIEPLIWALIAVVWVGLGPFAGIIALTIHSVAALGKLYSEAIENIDRGPIEAIQATGANRIQTIMFAVVPQMISPFVSFSIYRWDINVRMSTVIGLVGGGGIGFILVQYIRLLDYRAAGIAVWFIALTVAILDYVSSEIRSRFV